jgi:hypothetical protein
MIKDNLIGYAHDGANVSSGAKEELLGILNEKFKPKPFYNLVDPCHSLSLILNQGYSVLPEEIQNFFNQSELISLENLSKWLSLKRFKEEIVSKPCSKIS